MPETCEVSYGLNQFGLTFLLLSSETEWINTIVSQKPKEVRPSARSDEEHIQGNNGETDIENRRVDVGTGEGRVRRMERVTRKLTLPYVNSQQVLAALLRKLKQGLCIYLEGWDGEGDGREFQKGGNICIPMADSC